MITHPWRITAQVCSWSVTFLWCSRAYGATRYMPRLPNLTTSEWDGTPQHGAGIAVIVPARNEAPNIAATLDTLLAQDCPNLRVIAIDDRSTDRTGEIIDDYAVRYPERLQVLHITKLPEGWLGKTHAMQIAVEQSHSEYLLFTDADILFDPTVVRRALSFARQVGADHVVAGPTPILRTRGEGVMMGFFQVLGLWATRPWRVADAKARDAIGVGAFNLVRRDALERIGGLKPQRMAVIEDATLGIRIKAAGFSQHLVSAPGMVRVHWAPGAAGIVRVMTKNLFSGVNFRPLLLLGGCLLIALLFFVPLCGLVWWPTLLPSLLALGCIALAYRAMGTMTTIAPVYVWTYPAGAIAFIWALLRSMIAAWVRRGVVWRGTHYPLRELRKHNSPFQWKRAAMKRVNERA